MCGIFGAVFQADGVSVDADAALRSIAYRGPDGSHVHRAPGLVLGHNRLAILDLTAAASQPMASADGSVVVVFNGEIYNHHELRAELVKKGHAFRSRSDTEVIVEGYRAWGEAVIERLDGMFALGLWDRRARKLLLARDRAGKKPLFYAHDRGGLRFASETNALFASGLTREPDPASFPLLLAFGYIPAPRSMYRGVTQLPPASVLSFEADHEPRVRRYWRAPFASPRIDVSEEEAASEVRKLVEAAVVRRLEADVPLGAFLSGGIDSTIVVGLMARHMAGKVRTFSIGFAGDARYDETKYARIAARAFGTEHTEFTLEPSSFDLVQRLVELHDGPFGDSSAIPTSIVSMLTRAHVTVALSGDGGDELFCGYPRFLAAEAEERVPLILRRAGSALLRSAPIARVLSARTCRLFSRAALPFPERLVAWNSFFATELDQVLRADVRRTLDLGDPLAFFAEIARGTRGATVLSNILGHNFETYLPYDLLVKSDRASMLHSLELRSPFLDTALIEYAATLPDRLLRRGTRTKWILRRAFEDLIPEPIQRRGKMGFGIPLGAWFRGDLRPYLTDHLNPRAELFEYIEPTFVRNLLDEHFLGRRDHGHRLWLLLTTQLWLKELNSRSRLDKVPRVEERGSPWP